MLNKLIIVSGHSGAGKTTILRDIMNNEIVSLTTRDMREGEVQGEDYHFTSRSTFESMLRDGAIIEHSEYDGNYYGLTKEAVERKLYKAPAFVVADFFGALTLKKLYPNSTSVFMYCDKSVAEQRLLSRGDSAEKVAARIATYHDEMINRIHYDYVIKNQGERNYVRDAVLNILRLETGMIDLNDYPEQEFLLW